MKRSLIRLGLLASVAALTWGLPQSLRAAPVAEYSPNDLLLFFQNPTGTAGTDQVLLFSLGSTFNVFRRAATPGDPTYGQTIALGNIGQQLTATYGANWTSAANTIFVGAAGQNASADPLSSTIENGDHPRTVYVTKPRTTVGSAGQASSGGVTIPSTSTAQTALANIIAVSNNNANKVAGNPTVLFTNNTIVDDQNPFGPTGNPATAYGQIAGGVMGPITSSPFTFGSIPGVVIGLDVYRATPVANATGSWEQVNTIPGVVAREGFYLGTVVLTTTGDVYLVPVTGNGQLPAPVITSPLTATGSIGVAFAYQIAATSLPTSFAASGLPAGLNVNPATGLISGIPSQEGSFPVSISATNSSGTDTATLTLTVSPNPNSPPIISSPVGFNALGLNQTGTLSVSAVGNNLTYQWFFNGRAIRGANGATLNVTADRRGVGRYSVTVTNPFGSAESKGLLTISDNGLLVYRLRGNGQFADTDGEQSVNLQGFLLVDPTNVEGRATLVTTRRAGRDTFFSTTDFPAAYATTGPVVRSRSVLTSAVSSGTYPQIEVQLLWLSGADALLSLDRNTLLVAPAAMSGIIASFDPDDLVIENLPLSVSVDRAATLRVRNAADYEAALTELTRGFIPEP